MRARSLRRWWPVWLAGLLGWGSAGAESAGELLEELRQLREQVAERRVELRRELEALREVLGPQEPDPSGDAAAAAAKTKRELEELRGLQESVERRRLQLHRELAALKEALTVQDERQPPPGQVEGMPAAMSQEELEAELRILREEIEAMKSRLAGPGGPGPPPAAFRVGGQVRTRIQWNDDDFERGAGDLVQLLRTRVSVTGTPHEGTEVFAQVQDARVWGEEAGTLADGSADKLDVHQAYLRLDAVLSVFSRPVAITVGRQELAYGNERLVSAVDWDNTGRAFDAVRLRYGRQGFLEFFSARLGENGLRDRNLHGLLGQLRLGGHVVEPSVLFEHDKNAGPERMKRGTLAGRAAGALTGATGHSFSYDVEGALQAGDAGLRRVLAWMAAGSVGYTAPSWRRHTVVLGVDWLSGDPDPADRKSRAFEPLFGDYHRFHGMADFFVDLPVDAAQRGLVDVMLRGGVNTAQSARLDLHLHHFALAEGASKMLGQEVDAVFSYTYNPACLLQVGARVFVPDDAMQSLRGGADPALKPYLQLVGEF